MDPWKFLLKISLWGRGFPRRGLKVTKDLWGTANVPGRVFTHVFEVKSPLGDLRAVAKGVGGGPL